MEESSGEKKLPIILRPERMHGGHGEWSAWCSRRGHETAPRVDGLVDEFKPYFPVIDSETNENKLIRDPFCREVDDVGPTRSMAGRVLWFEEWLRSKRRLPECGTGRVLDPSPRDIWEREREILFARTGRKSSCSKRSAGAGPILLYVPVWDWVFGPDAPQNKVTEQVERGGGSVLCDDHPTLKGSSAKNSARRHTKMLSGWQTVNILRFESAVQFVVSWWQCCSALICNAWLILID